MPGALAFPALAVLALSGAAQVQFDQLGKQHLPRDEDEAAAVAVGDVDGDGDPDLVFGNRSGQNRLYLNDGSGIFTDATATRMPIDSDTTVAVALGDVDGDGDLDLVLGNVVQNRLYLNDGSGTFNTSVGRMPVVNDITLSVALGDVDGDGDLDLVFGNGVSLPYQQNRLYLNNGAGFFADATAGRMPIDSDDTNAVALCDVDGDGDRDLVLGNDAIVFGLGQQNRIYRNDGAGTFTDATAALLPATVDHTEAVVVGDVDGDGDPDLVFGNFQEQNRLYLNDGTGLFIDATAGMPIDNDSTQDVALCDVDGDGDSDLVFGNWGQNRLYLNAGTGSFTDATAGRLPMHSDFTSATALADLDGDGDLDLALGNRGVLAGERNGLHVNDGNGIFVDATADRMPTDADGTRAVALCDVDGDGDRDLVFGNDLRQNRLYLNDGSGNFINATAARMPIDNDRSLAVAAGDVDGDSDLDLVFGNNGYNRLYRNDGTGTFSDATDASLPAFRSITQAVVLGDVDGDGDLDLIFGNNGQNRLYLNDGTGAFADVTAGHVPVRSDNSRAVVLDDVDGDGDLDLVCGNNLRQNRLYLNDGTGTFTDATAGRMPLDSDSTRAVALCDVDGDSDPDLVFGNIGQNRLYLNDGTGNFADATAARLPIDSDSTVAVAVGDVDADGHPDLVLANDFGEQNRLYLGSGTGSFTDATAARLPSDSDLTNATALGDVDGDGDPDLVFGNIGPNRLHFNLLRQLDTPFLVVRGREYRLEAYARHGLPRARDVVVPFVSTAPARIPLPPFGTFGLHPSSLAALPVFIIPQPAGVGSVSFVVPNTPGVVGVPLHAQALLVQSPAPSRLTNVTADRIVR